MKGEITKALEDALALRKGLIADGTPVDEADRISGELLKAAMGNDRHERWRFYCDDCRDTGWRLVDGDLEKRERFYGTAEDSHGTYVKCEPCRWMKLEREKRRKSGGNEFGDDDVVGAGQIKPSRKFSKFGG